MSSSVTRFLGDSPTRVAIKLFVMSLVVGIVMRAVGWSARDIWFGILDAIEGIWNLGFEALYNALDYLLLGAAIVVPLFIVIRVLNFRNPK